MLNGTVNGPLTYDRVSSRVVSSLCFTPTHPNRAPAPRVGAPTSGPSQRYPLFPRNGLPAPHYLAIRDSLKDWDRAVTPKRRGG